MAPDLDFARIYTKSQQFENQFQELGPLSNLLALFSICPSLGDVFSQFHIPYTPQSSVVYNAIVFTVVIFSIDMVVKRTFSLTGCYSLSVYSFIHTTHAI